MRIIDNMAISAAQYFHYDHTGLSRVVKVALVALSVLVLTCSVVGIPLIYKIAVEYVKLDTPPRRDPPPQRSQNNEVFNSDNVVWLADLPQLRMHESGYPLLLVQAVGEKRFKKIPTIERKKIVNVGDKYVYSSVKPENMLGPLMKGKIGNRLFLFIKFCPKTKQDYTVDVISGQGGKWFVNESRSPEIFKEEHVYNGQLSADIDPSVLRKISSTTLGFIQILVQGLHKNFKLAT